MLMALGPSCAFPSLPEEGLECPCGPGWTCVAEICVEDQDAGMDASLLDAPAEAGIDSGDTPPADVPDTARSDAPSLADAPGSMDAPTAFDAPASMDAGRDARVDTGRDAPVDTGRDAPVDTGRDAPVDAGRDAPVPSCSRRCFELPLTSSFGIGMPLNTADPTRWTRPEFGGCPAAAGTGNYRYDFMRFYNGGAGVHSIRLSTRLSAAGFDTAMFVYLESSPDLSMAPSLPASPTSCLSSANDTPGAGVHEEMTVAVPAGDSILVVVTTAVPEASGQAQLNVSP